MCFVFFFKQKTAYEMRISDWSSDVCSSDLFYFGIAVWVHDGQIARTEPAAAEGLASGGLVLQVAFHERIAAHDQPTQRLQIGQASWRERECRYVEIRGVAGTIKKQKKRLKRT